MWFTENAWPPMLICVAAGLLSLWIWNANRRQMHLVAAGVFFLLAGGIYAAEQMIMTEGERLQQDLLQLSDQFRRHDPMALDHFSQTAGEWRAICQQAMDMVEIQDDLRLFNFQTQITNQNSRATVDFRANATITALGTTVHHPFRCIMTYQREGGEWKIIHVERLDPMNGKRMGVLDPR